MKKRDGILAAAALVSVIVYSLACRPAWHPSGKSVAFPFADSESSGIGIYNTDTGEVVRLYEEAEGMFGSSHCLWTSDGSKLLVVAPGEDESIRVMTIDPAGGSAETVATVADLDEAVVVYPPVLAHDRYLWIGSLNKEDEEGSFYVRVDLAEKEVKEFFNSTDSGTVCFDFAERGCFYQRVYTTPEDTRRNEIGEFDAVSGKTKPLFSVPEDDYGPWGFLAAEPEGARFALPVEVDDTIVLRILDRKGKTAKDIPLPEKLTDAGYLAWIGGVVWIAAETTVEEGETDNSEVGLLSVDVASGKSRFIPLADSNDNNRDNVLYIQPSVSPDGKRLAVSGLALGEPEEGKTTALVLLDLTDLDKPPVMIPLPPGEPAEEETPEEPVEEEPAKPAEKKAE